MDRTDDVTRLRILDAVDFIENYEAADALFIPRVKAYVTVENASEHELAECFRILQKYKRQLRVAGIDVSSIPRPTINRDVREEAHYRARQRYWNEKQGQRQAAIQPRLDFIDGNFIFSRSYSIKDTIKALPYNARSWDDQAKVWRVFDKDATLAVVGIHGTEIIISNDAEVALTLAQDEFELPEPKIMRAFSADRVEITFPYDPNIVADVRALPGAFFDRPRNRWTAEVSLRAIQFARKYAFEIEPAELMALAEEIEAEAAEIQEELDERAERSRATDTDVEVALSDQLFPFQRAGVAYALETKRTFIADEMGLGKTRQFLSLVETANAYPAVVVCPGGLKENWKVEAAKLLPGRTVAVAKGRTPVELEADITVINYDILPWWVMSCKNCGELVKSEVIAGRPRVIHDEKRMRKRRREGERLCQNPEPIQVFKDIKAIGFDESHYAKNPKAIRTQAAIDAAANFVDPDGYVINLTGTPLLNRPIELIPQLDILGRLDDFGGERVFLERYVDYQWNGNSFTPSGAKNVDELHNMLRQTCYVRRVKQDVLTELPEKLRAPLWIGGDDCDRDYIIDYRTAESDLLGFLAQTRGVAAAQRAARAEAIVRINVLRTLIAKAKVEAAVEWVDNFLKSGKSLVVFAVHKDIQRELIKQIERRCTDENDKPVRVVALLGAKGKKGTEIKREFNEAVEVDGRVTKVIICSLAADREGHTLTKASDVLFVEQGWTPGEHAQAEDRCHRVCPHGKQNNCDLCGGVRDCVTAWYLLVNGTIDGMLFDLIAEKRKIVDAVADGIESMDEESMMGALITRLRERAYEGAENLG